VAIILRQDRTVFDWKITYDETNGDCSPGMLLAQDYTAAFLSDIAIDLADSCAADDSGLLGTLWADRRSMADFVLDTRGNSTLFLGLAGVEKCRVKARRLAKKSISFVGDKLRRKR